MTRIVTNQVIVLLFLISLVQACDQSPEKGKSPQSILFKKFDLFNLRGFDTIKNNNAKEFVQVKYSMDLTPIEIKYKMLKRTVTIFFEDTIYDDRGNKIHIYTTSNLYGGPPGRHRVYSAHYEEYKDLIYVSFSDTLLCQTENVPMNSNYTFHLFTKNRNESVRQTSLGEIDFDGSNKKLSKGQLYSKWSRLLRDKLYIDTSSQIIIDGIPGN